MTNFVFAGMPWPDLGLGLVLCLVVSALGFLRVDWFISIGYGASIAALAVLFAVLHPAQLGLGQVALLLLLAAYGVRLASYLIARERSPAFARELEASRERSAGIAGGAKVAIWISVSALYVAMASPGLFVLIAESTGPLVLVGVVLAALGLLLETASDLQKARLKAADPSRYVSAGLFSVVRSPNYLGEMLFWLGVFVAGLGAYQSLAAWLVALTGLVCIELIMLGSARRLEMKQAERYGGREDYRRYVATVPILFPAVPLYSLRRLRVYLG
jgi:steroid 5-alpha reductase family enzyme